MKARDAMTSPAITIHQEATLREAGDVLARHGISDTLALAAKLARTVPGVLDARVITDKSFAREPAPIDSSAPIGSMAA